MWGSTYLNTIAGIPAPAPSGSHGLRSAPVAMRRPAAPSRSLMPEPATGKRSASIHAVTPLADPSPVSGSLRSRRCLFRLIFAPRNTVGGKNGRFALSGSGFAALLFSPLRPGGVRGKRKRRVSRGLRNRSRWSLRSSRPATYATPTPEPGNVTNADRQSRSPLAFRPSVKNPLRIRPIRFTHAMIIRAIGSRFRHGTAHNTVISPAGVLGLHRFRVAADCRNPRARRSLRCTTRRSPWR
jgi:hypothetical protein